MMIWYSVARRGVRRVREASQCENLRRYWKNGEGAMQLRQRTNSAAS
jgi:hypothetical protein